MCKPLHCQLQLVHARAGVAVAAAVAIVVAGPALSIYGNRTVDTSVAGLRGCDCSVQDKHQGRLYPLLYELVFGAAFVAYTVVLAGLYLAVWVETRRHRKYMASHSIPNLALSSLLVTTADDDASSSTVAAAESPESARRKTSRSVPSEISAKLRKSMRASKLTVVAVAVTVVFVVSYLPHLCLIILRTVMPDIDHHQTGARLVLYNIFLRSYFLNSVANVFVYSAMNMEFRLECKRLCGCVKRSEDEVQAVAV